LPENLGILCVFRKWFWARCASNAIGGRCVPPQVSQLSGGTHARKSVARNRQVASSFVGADPPAYNKPGRVERLGEWPSHFRSGSEWLKATGDEVGRGGSARSSLHPPPLFRGWFLARKPSRSPRPTARRSR